ncbi:tyrosine-type recombinase/integrase [Mesorhizobium escarrei]|uniref:Site-specific integrase n=1 Tax=Mesorhizobium escarrei TaxID=666018 RepID=A0ABN8KIA1_9HYPH|nr:site-specific integrase [Mesorhizobium escarrei]CAH2409385.1 Site-specific integrase [Mesorhizobium escarrei]
MSLRERTWTTKSGEVKSAYIIDYYTQTGKRHIKTFAKKKDAQAFEAKTRIEVNGHVHVADRETVTIAEAGKFWLKSCDGFERSTINQYTQHLNLHIVPFIGKRKLTEVTVPFVRQFMDTLREQGRSDAMLRNVRISLGAILSDAQERGLVVLNAVKEMSRNKKGRAKAKERHKGQLQVGVDIPTPQEVRAILDHAEGRVRVFLMTAVLTGMRASELRGLRWSDVDLAKAEITVRQRADAYQAIGSPKSKKGRRTIPIDEQLVTALRDWRAACPKGDLDLVFPNTEGNIEWHANIVKRWLHPALEAAGVVAATGETDADGEPIMEAKYTGLHALRHFYASWCINRPEDGGFGLPAKVVQERMGHSSIVVTLDTYGHLFPKGDDASAMNAATASLLG